MIYSNLGDTNLKVSKICLGTMTFGEPNTQKQSHELLDYAFDHGVNFIDTAEMYPVPPRETTYGESERIIGKWSKLSSHRDQVIVATKAVGANDWLTYVRNGQACLNKENLFSAVEDSLQRLKIDYIDLFQLHWPDRPTNYFGILGYYPTNDLGTPIEETLEALEDLKNQGKIRQFGISNETPWGVHKFLEISKEKNLPRLVSIQNPYSLLNRTFEIGLAEMAYRENCPLLAYSPLGFGVLSGKYLNNKKPANARLTLFERFTRYTNSKAIDATNRYVEIAKKFNYDPAQMALAFVNSKKFVASNIIGATNLEQLKSNIKSIDINLTQELIVEIEQIHMENPNPSP